MVGYLRDFLVLFDEGYRLPGVGLDFLTLLRELHLLDRLFNDLGRLHRALVFLGEVHVDNVDTLMLEVELLEVDCALRIDIIFQLLSLRDQIRGIVLGESVSNSILIPIRNHSLPPILEFEVNLSQLLRPSDIGVGDSQVVVGHDSGLDKNTILGQGNHGIFGIRGLGDCEFGGVALGSEHHGLLDGGEVDKSGGDRSKVEAGWEYLL